MAGVTSRVGRPAEVLRGLAISDERLIERLVNVQMGNIEASGLDPRTHALVRIAALLALDAAPASFAWQVGVGMESGVSQEEIMGVIVAVAPTVGMAKIVATAPEIAYAMDLELGEIEAAP